MEVEGEEHERRFYLGTTEGNVVARTLILATGVDDHFPEFEGAAWVLEEEEHHEADAKHAYPFTFRTYSRLR